MQWLKLGKLARDLEPPRSNNDFRLRYDDARMCLYVVAFIASFIMETANILDDVTTYVFLVNLFENRSNLFL